MLKRIISSALGFIGYQLVRTPHTCTESDRLSPQDREFAFISRLPGFLTRDAYDLFCKLASHYSEKEAAVLELGIFCGRSFLGLGFAFANASRVIGVDPFYEDFKKSPAFEDEGRFLEKACHSLEKSQRLALLSQALKRSEEFRPGLATRLAVREMTQCSFLETKNVSEKFDVVHLDGEHTFEAIDEFLGQIDNTLYPKSLVIVDDFFNAGFPGISEAVHTNCIYKTELFPVFYGFNKAVFIYKPQAHQVSELTDRLTAHYKKDSRVIRSLDDGSIVVQ